LIDFSILERLLAMDNSYHSYHSSKYILIPVFPILLSNIRNQTPRLRYKPEHDRGVPTSSYSSTCSILVVYEKSVYRTLKTKRLLNKPTRNPNQNSLNNTPSNYDFLTFLSLSFLYTLPLSFYIFVPR